jgi:hypothetical protein
MLEYASLRPFLVDCPTAQGASTQLESQSTAPQFVLVPPDGRHLLVDSRQSFYTLTIPDGACLYHQSKGGLDVCTAAVDNRWVLISTLRTDWSGADRDTIQGGGEVVAAFRESDNKRSFVYYFPSIVGDDLMRGATLFGANGTGGLWWSNRQSGLGAVSTDWHMVIALDDGELRVHGPEPTNSRLTVFAVRQLGVQPAQLSLAPPLIIVLAYEAEGTRVLALDGLGDQQWSVFVNVRTAQPAIDGADGRIYVAGNGLAAVDHGKVLWSQLDDAKTMATAFADGALAVAVGPELRFMNRDGVIKQRFLTAENEPITTPPAIASDGSVWVGTRNGLYVAR